MGIDELLLRLERDADARVAEIRARAQAEIDAIAAETERASEEARRAALDAMRAERRNALGRALAEARRGAAARVLLAEHALVDRVLSRARTLFAQAARDPANAATFARQREEALRFTLGREAVVRAPPEHEGIAIEVRDGSVAIDDTLAARLERMRPRLAMRVVRELCA